MKEKDIHVLFPRMLAFFKRKPYLCNQCGGKIETKGICKDCRNERRRELHKKRVKSKRKITKEPLRIHQEARKILKVSSILKEGKNEPAPIAVPNFAKNSGGVNIPIHDEREENFLLRLSEHFDCHYSMSVERSGKCRIQVHLQPKTITFKGASADETIRKALAFEKPTA